MDLDLEHSAPSNIDPLQADWEAEEDRAAAIWTIPLRKRVRFRLQGLKDEFEGLIRLARRPTVLDPHRTLNLRMKNIHFTNHEIEACAVID
jgi:hypothetical protein